jgi:hypothetical protein
MSGIDAEKVAQLAAEFPREAISWRAQSLTRAGDKAMALAYIDARDVMDRLDLICGPENWQDGYVETAKGRVIATIEINVGGTWIRKSDGAGDTAVEGDKGGISDAFKRAAVKWGVGRYLYDMPTIWVPCESYESNGKKHWKAWKQSPWDFVKKPPVVTKDQTTTYISDAQRQDLMTLAQARGVALNAILKFYKIPDLRELLAADFDGARLGILNTPARKEAVNA